jgi:nucleoside-diphosphate-sugar epimerase
MNSLNGKIILVTGATGFIGTHLAKRLSEIAGIKLLLLSRRLQEDNQEGAIWLHGELADLTPEFWHSRNIDCIDYVFHLGSFTPKLPAEANQIDQIVDDNILGTRTLLRGLPGKLIKLVFASSIDIYQSPNNGEVLNEISKINPSTLHGVSKLFCEKMVDTWAEEEGCEVSILRYGHIYGPGESKYKKFIPTVIRSLLNNQAPLVNGDGSALRDYLYVEDVVEATIRSALVPGDIGPVNIVRGSSVTLKEVALSLIRLMGSSQSITFNSRALNGSSLRFDNERMAKLLGDWPMIDLEEGLKAEIAAFRRVEDEC